MTINLGGVTINDNMFLGGLRSASKTSASQVRTVEGNSWVTSKPKNGGRNLTLGTSSGNGAIMGIWCQSIIDDVKILEQLSQSVTLDYHGDIYSVVITGSSKFEPIFITEPEGPNKKMTGQFLLTEG